MNDNNLIWIDLEMTGLNPDTDMILEIATVVTDSELNVLAEGPSLAIFQPDEILDKMDDWNKTHHGQSGLIQRVKESTISTQEAERLTLEFLQIYVPQNKSPMCGNSICQDRRFLWRLMPQLEAYFFYRHIDVSTLKELAKRWKPNIADGFKKESEHLALKDIHDSIAELKYYRQLFLQ